MKVDFNELLDEAICKEREERTKRERSGKFSPSRMGKCYRYQVWQRQGVPETDEIPMAVFRKFRAGNIYHKDLQGMVDDVEVEYEDESFKMFADHVGEDYVVDFKTVFSGQFKRMKKMSSEDIVSSKEQYVYQLMAYCHFLKKSTGYLVFVNKDDYDIIQVEVLFKDWKRRLEDEVGILLGYWKKGTVPPCLPRAYGGKEKTYCPYRSHPECAGC